MHWAEIHYRHPWPENPSRSDRIVPEPPLLMGRFEDISGRGRTTCQLWLDKVAEAPEKLFNYLKTSQNVYF